MCEPSLRQEGRDLQVGIEPRIEPAVQLEDEAVAEDHRAVALLGARRDDAQVVRDLAAKGSERSRRLAGELTSTSAQAATARDRGQEHIRERGDSHGVDEDPCAGSVALALESRNAGPRRLGQHRCRSGLGQGGNRDEIFLRIALRELDTQDQQQGRCLARAHRDCVADLRRCDPPCLAAEPAAVTGPCRQELGQGCGAWSRRQVGQLVHRRQAGQLGRIGRERPRFDRWRLEREPHERMGPQAQEIRHAPDRREVHLAEQLHGSAPLERREVQLAVLGEARQVGHDQEGLVCVATYEGQDVAVVGVQELDRTTTEGPVPLAERDEPLHPPQQ